MQCTSSFKEKISDKNSVQTVKDLDSHNNNIQRKTTLAMFQKYDMYISVCVGIKIQNI